MTSRELVSDATPSLSPVPAPAGPDSAPRRVVAIGASAGGLESLQQLFAALPSGTNMAFVVVQHLSPDFKSLMPELLGRQTRMPVLAVDRDLPLRADTVYVLSAGFAVELNEGRLMALPRAHDAAQPLPINRLFNSLGALGDRAAAVVLSGTGQDGMAGAKTVKQAGGLVVAQLPSSARFDSMPRAIIDAGVADIVALPSEIGRALVNWLQDPVAGRKFTSEASDGDSLLTGPYGPVLNVLQHSYDLDFAHYKSGTIMRRIDRWLSASGRPVTPATLAAHLEGKPAEVDRLFGDLLIGVTSFFRDPEAFEVLRLKSIEPMIDALGEREQLRIWCCACSTGEEAYTLAILAIEAFERRGIAPRLRVLATDVHPASVQRASSGVYTEEVLGGMPESLRQKYFVPLPSGHYKVTEGLRRHVVFSVQNVLKDAGFQRIDIVCCRNMMIYLRPPAQAQVLASFHTSLHAGGVLMLGKSEMPSEHGEAFMPLDDAAHLYTKRPGLQLPLQARPLFGVAGAQRPSLGMPLDNRASYRLQEVLAQRYVPSGFLVNQIDELVYVFGRAGQYLQAAPGRFGGTMFNLLAGPLRTAVSISLRKAAQNMTPASMDDVIADEEHPEDRVRVDVDPIADRTLPHHYFMVRITPVLMQTDEPEPAVQRSPDLASTEHIAALEAELMRTREALQRSIEDLEAANEELQAGNEELMAANEELQSSNEELHALNEELYSVNSEHELKIQELRDTSTDLNNLIRATELAIVFLDMEARLRLYTPPATLLFPLRPEDVGRELSDLVPREADPPLFEDIAQALVGGETGDHELVLSSGRTMRRRITPYRTDLGVISGLVITYVDVTQAVTLREQQAALHHQSELAAIVESVPHLMWTCDARGQCDFLSRQWEAYTGVPAAPQLGYGWIEQVHPDDRDALNETWGAAVRSATAMRTRFRIRRHDGQWRWFETHAVPQLDGRGRVVKWFGSNTDVHEVEMLRRALEERERFVQMVADNVNGMIGYWDLEQRNHFANRHYLGWFGLSAEQVRGRSMREVLGEKVYAANLPYVEAALRGEPQRFERSIIKPDGSVGHLFAEYQPHVVDGQVQGFIVTATDITEVQEARLLADQTFLVSPVSMMVFDEQRRLARWNPAARRLLGYRDDQLPGLSLDALVPAAARQRHAMLAGSFMVSPSHRPMGDARTFPLVRADGTEVEVDVELSGVRVSGRPAAIACVRETALSVAAQSRLDRALRARGQFLAQMSHEIRTPLNAILGMAQLLLLESPTPKQGDRLRRIEEASNLLLGIVNDVLDLTKMEAGKLQLTSHPLRLAEVVDRCVAMVHERARLKQLQVSAGIDPGVPAEVVGDAQRIEQILVNLLSNAVKFTHEGSVQVRVTAAPAADSRVVLRVEVADTGIGIAASDMAELFAPFRQVQQGHARSFGGTGLGLSICLQLARAMGGECGVTSTPGVGSTFWFTVLAGRVREGDRLAAAAAQPAAMPAGGFPGRRVLIIEDNPVNRLVAHELLETVAKVSVIDAEDGEQALQIAARERFDLVLVDLQMPGIDGLETARRLRQLRGYDTVPIYALSANVHAEDIHASLAAGMNGHFGKPLVVEALTETFVRLWGQPSARPAAARQRRRKVGGPVTHGKAP